MSTKTATKKTVAEPKKVAAKTPVTETKKAAPKKAAAKKTVKEPKETKESKEDETSQNETSDVKETKETKKDKKPKAKVAPGPKRQRTRRVVTKESLEKDFETLQAKIEEEIAKLREGPEKVKGVKFLRSVNKSVKILKSDSVRVLKIKPKTNRNRSTASGFMKPVRLSEEMLAFTSWDATKLYSRVDVTKFICQYIREQNLQNPEDRRKILCDDKLKALLKYDAAVAKDPLTYFRLQQYIQPHFIKEVKVVPPPVEKAEDETVDVEEADEE